MDQGPAYRVVADSSITVDTVALEEFGGGRSDAVVAWVTVDGEPVVRVVAPPEQAGWDDSTRERFREAVRALARSHHLLGRADAGGTVAVVWNPPDAPESGVPAPVGEPIQRS